MKSKQKSLPAALNDPLMIHYRRDLMIDSFGSKSLLLSLIKWVPHLRYWGQIPTTTILRTLIETAFRSRKACSISGAEMIF